MTAGRLFTLIFCLFGSANLLAQQIAVVADLNGRYGSTQYHKRVAKAGQAIEELGPDLVISAMHLPDMTGTELVRTMRNPLTAAGIPLAVTPGNHDGSGFERFALEREYFERQWKNRSDGLELLAGSEWPRRYAARLDSVLLLSFDGTIPGRLSSKEFGFVEKMLEKYRASASTVIVLSHLPMWPLASGREREMLNDPELLELLHRFDVDVFLSGHHALFYAGRDAGGMIHLATGALGGNARAFSGSNARQAHSFALLEIRETGVHIEARPASGFTESIDLATLPPYIDGALGRLERIDLVDD